MPKDGHYAGTTAQGKPISFDVAGGATLVDEVTYDLEETCDPNDLGAVTFTGSFGRANLSLDGSFTESWTGNDSNAGQLSTVTMSGKVDASGGATGTIRVNTDADIQGIHHCTSGDVSWSAHLQ